MYLSVFFGYFLIMLFISLKYTATNKQDYMLANRNVGLWDGAASTAITWVNAPALFISAKVMYLWGIVGFAWFIIPNALTLIVFAYFASKIRKQYPEGVTFSDYIKSKFSPRIHKLYLFELLSIDLFILLVNVLAGATVLTALTGISFFTLTLLLSLIPLLYTISGGFKVSVITDKFQYILMVAILLVIIPYVVYAAGGISYISLFGSLPGFENFLTPKALALVQNFGIPAMLGLISGAIGCQQFWQRAFAQKEGTVVKSFVLSGFLFALVPTMIAVLGLVATSSGMVITDTFLTNIAVIKQYGSDLLLVPFIIMLISGLMSSIDSALASLSSIFVTDTFERLNEKYNFKTVALFAMVFFSILTIIICNIPGMTVLYAWLFFGMIRSVTFIPSMIIVGTNWKISESFLFWGILLTFIFGLPAFVYVNFINNNMLIMLVSLAMMFTPVIFMGIGKIKEFFVSDKYKLTAK